MNKFHRAIVFVFLIIATGESISAQQFAGKKPATDKVTSQLENIDAIRAEYKKINSLKLTIQHFKYQDLPCVDEGVTNYFMEGSNVRKITEKFIKGDGYSATEFYFKDGKFIFALEVIVGGPAMGPETKTEYRYYAKDDKALRQLEGDKIVAADSKFTDALTRGYQLIKARTAKDFKKAICIF
ncbi:hypothetical protein [Chryseobacterium sp. Mn2064]|uniref:hypothetical protein n=1 Tax=Chryseobacterium sp. Mn2064 TaxID=3395263 RepID=UPI003BBE33A6